VTLPLLELVPNVSEGRDEEVIAAIAAHASVPGARLLDVDSGFAAHRTVLTVAGDPEALEASARALIAEAVQRIDLRRHQGTHPRIGAADVVPFVPLLGAGLEICADLARRVGRWVGEELGLPVYLYGSAAKSRSLATVRRGGFEGLGSRTDQPDFGPRRPHPTAGAVAVGARPVLIAFNVNLDRADADAAAEIARRIRSSGSGPRRLDRVQALGWLLDNRGVAQVSCNLADWRRTPLHVVYDACVDESNRLGIGVTGSELVGMAPLGALLAAGDHALLRQGGDPSSATEPQRVTAADRYLGLSSLRRFEPELKILERRLPELS
jgi:glutamate formiminotransferase/formiminotetrahydrofolate cyclodeaminase